MKNMLWSLSGNDWACRNKEDAGKITRYLIRNVKSRDIILLHDDNPYVLNILESLIPALKMAKFDLQKGIEALKEIYDD
jgi:hypothetical protein